jgi:hypothetical protein
MRWLVGFAVTLVGCGSGDSPVDPPLAYLNLHGTFVATMYDDRVPPMEFLPISCGWGEDVEGDTIWISLSRFSLDFGDLNADPEEWDQVEWEKTVSIPCGAGQTDTGSGMWAYRATTDSLFLRYADGTVVPARWRVLSESFDLPYTLSVYRSAVVRFDRVWP